MNRLEDFLRMYGHGTARAYSWGLTEFFKSVYGENEGRLGEYAEQYFNEERDVERDLENFFVTIKEKPPKSVKLMFTAVRGFLIENDVEIPEKFWRRLRRKIKGSRALTLDKVPSNVEFRRIIMHMPIQGKALFLTLASSGMRIGEALKLKLEDIELDKTPCKINIRGKYTKTGNSRITFISKEARITVEEWLKVRSKYLKSAVGRSHRYAKNVEDNRLFPFRDNTAYYVWRRALKKSGFAQRDASTNRRMVHPHVLRKFFRTKMGALIPVDVAEALMGHEEYLTEVYRRYSMEALAKFYLQGEPALLIFTEAEQVVKLRKEVEQNKSELQSMVNHLQMKSIRLEEENVELKNRQRKTEDKLSEMEQSVKELRKLIEQN